MAVDRSKGMLTIFALLFFILGISNVLKPFQLLGEQTGFVLFGQRLSGTANAVAGPLFGLYLFVYAFGIWRRKWFALPMSHAYATYVVVNLIMFNLKSEHPPGIGYLLFGIIYSLVAVGVSCGAAYFLTKQKTALAE